MVDSTPKGIKNIGNTCFINSAIQCLRSVEPFKDALESRSSRRKSLNSLLVDFVCREKDCSVEFLPFLVRLSGRFFSFNQEDAHELLIYVLQITNLPKSPFKGKMQSYNVCYNCMFKCEPKPIDFNCLSLSFPETRQKYRLGNLSEETNSEDSSLTKLLFFYFNNFSNDMECKNCISGKKLETINNKINEIDMKFKSELELLKERLKSKSLQSFMKFRYRENYQIAKKILENSDRNGFLEDFVTHFENNDKETNPTNQNKERILLRQLLIEKEKIINKKQTKKKSEEFQTIGTVSKITQFPSAFCIHLKRGLLYNKNDTFVKFEEILEIGDFDITEDKAPKNDLMNSKYILTALIEHRGNATGGHYVSYRKKSDVWYFCSDLDVRKTNLKEVLNAEAYILFYTKFNDMNK